ncbi:MAG: UDP-N-acetylmuramate--L-alanine ligase [Oscillospiraceae bacterium]|nr:UDP-N-acetylmuramate--L-alanine ligase [Oscillospiraceae bacterium]
MIDDLLKKVKRVHMIGIGGSGMCPLAEILHSEGYSLSGSDNNESDTLFRIRALGIPVAMGQRAENIGGAEMIVYTAALLKDNPELVAAKASGIPTFERSKLFGAITRRYKNCFAVCGTHGKTTATSMLAQIMLTAGLDPTCVIGGKLPLIGGNGRVGSSDAMVCEACEFADTFLDLSPATSVFLNIDADHLDYFKTVENLIASFTKFADLTRDRVIYNGDDERTLISLRGVTGKDMVSFGLGEGCDYRAVNIAVRDAFAEFDMTYRGELLVRVRLGVPGRHNVYNAMAAFAAAHKNGVDAYAIADSLAEFRGAGRRFEILGVRNGVTIADDYAHHPKEIEVTLNAAKEMNYSRVWAVFQPFTFSRTAMLIDDFADALNIADKVVMTEIMGSREINTYGVKTEHLAEKIGKECVWYDTFEEVARHVVDHAESGDLVITLGCGDIYKAAKIMLKMYDEQS